MMKRRIKLVLTLIGALSLSMGCESKTEEVAEETAEAAAEAAGASEIEEIKAEEAAEEAVENMEEAGDGDRLAARQGKQVTPVGSVIYTDAEAPKLTFYKEDIDCAKIVEQIGDDKIIVSAELEPGMEGVPKKGAMAVKHWHYYLDGEKKGAKEGSEDAVMTVTKATPAALEGVVKMKAEVDDDVFELDGPYVATICDVKVKPIN